MEGFGYQIPQEMVAAYQYLSPEAYRYYLPALLTKSLDDCDYIEGPERDQLIDSVLYMLQPDDVGVNADGEDLEHQYLTSLFDEKQYKAVCSFLLFGLERGRYQKFQTASALIHRWNRYEHLALARAREFYQAMHNYQYPASSNPEVNVLIGQIRSAFDKTPHPNPRANKREIYDIEAAEYAVAFHNANWKTLHVDYVSNYDSALSFFSPAEFRYFLPAYMIADLMIPEIEGSWSNANPVFHLTSALAEDMQKEAGARMRLFYTDRDAYYSAEWNLNQFPLSFKESEKSERYKQAEQDLSVFNRQEREAIIQFLRYQTIDATKDGKFEIKLALERYWLKPIRQEIEDAFAAVSIPEASQLIDETVDHPGARALAQALAGRSRASLDANFVQKWQPLFRHLTPEAYRYYFLALLPYGLEPDYVQLCATGKDTIHQYQTSPFSERQYKAACACVELRLAEQRFEMAAAFIHRWNRYEHPALERARAFYQRMHNFEYPASTEPEINELIRQIRQAFDNTPYPNDAICEPLDVPESARAAIEFRGTDWRTLHPDFVASYMGEAALPFFTDKAFRYFLPAYLIADLMVWEREHEWIEGNLARHLTHGLTKETPEDDSEAFEKSAQRFANFSQPERDAIVSYLHHQMKTWPRADIKSALRNYWLKPVRQFREEDADD